MHLSCHFGNKQLSLTHILVTASDFDCEELNSRQVNNSKSVPNLILPCDIEVLYALQYNLAVPVPGGH